MRAFLKPISSLTRTLTHIWVHHLQFGSAFTEVGIYKRKKDFKRLSKKTRSRPRKKEYSKKIRKKHDLDQENRGKKQILTKKKERKHDLDQEIKRK